MINFKRLKEIAKKGLESLVIVALISRLFFYEYYGVPSCSMTPTLHTGDFTLAKKHEFHWSVQTLPFGGILPFKNKKFVFRAPVHGDMVAFSMPERSVSTYYVKRVVGVAGDYVQMKNGVLHINDVACKMEDCGPYTFVTDDNRVETGRRYKVILPSGKWYYIYRNLPFGMGHIDNTPKYKVPEGTVWVQGDNNTGSADCFSPHFMGPLKVENIVAKVFFVISGSNDRGPNVLFFPLNIPINIFRHLFIYLNKDRILKNVQ